jgi:hypothetical protein
MRDKIIEMIKHYDQIDWNISCVGPSEYLEVLADQILALFPSLEGIEVEEKCTNHLESPENLPYQICTICRTATGTITRQATIEEFIEWGINLLKTAEHSFGYETFKSISELPEGGRLRIREKD